VLSNLVRNQAKVVERFGLLRLDAEDLPIQVFSGFQSSGPMMLNRTCQFFRNASHIPIIAKPPPVRKALVGRLNWGGN
jgi:hypothetical protein